MMIAITIIISSMMISSLLILYKELKTYVEYERIILNEKLKEQCTIKINQIYFVEYTNDVFLQEYVGKKFLLVGFYLKPFFSVNTCEFDSLEGLSLKLQILGYNFDYKNFSNNTLTLFRNDNNSTVVFKKYLTIKEKINLI